MSERRSTLPSKPGRGGDHFGGLGGRVGKARGGISETAVDAGQLLSGAVHHHRHRRTAFRHALDEAVDIADQAVLDRADGIGDILGSGGNGAGERFVFGAQTIGAEVGRSGDAGGGLLAGIGVPVDDRTGRFVEDARQFDRTA